MVSRPKLCTGGKLHTEYSSVLPLRCSTDFSAGTGLQSLMQQFGQGVFCSGIFFDEAAQLPSLPVRSSLRP